MILFVVWPRPFLKIYGAWSPHAASESFCRCESVFGLIIGELWHQVQHFYHGCYPILKSGKFIFTTGVVIYKDKIYIVIAFVVTSVLSEWFIVCEGTSTNYSHRLCLTYCVFNMAQVCTFSLCISLCRWIRQFYELGLLLIDIWLSGVQLKEPCFWYIYYFQILWLTFLNAPCQFLQKSYLLCKMTH